MSLPQSLQLFKLKQPILEKNKELKYVKQHSTTQSHQG